MPGMTDTLDFVKNLWGSINIPGTKLSGMSGPTLSTEDLDKRIADLKAVESWLNMNLTMLRGTIQTMEVQRTTLTALKSMGSSMAGTPFGPFFGQPGAPGAEQNPAQDPAAAVGMPAAMAWWNMLQEQFTQAVATAMTPVDAASKAEPQGEPTAAPAQSQGGAAPDDGANPGPSGNGKSRPGKPKTDKT
jgi:hypothetical protein